MRIRCTLLLLLIGFTAYCQQKVTCIGASITWGATIPDREHNSFPAQLQTLLGKGYSVTNLGVSGTTLLKKGNLPYWNTKEYQQALQSKPDIVVIDLGGNDAKAVNRPFYADLQPDLIDLVQTFKKLPTHPRVIVLTPVVSFVTDSTGIWDPAIVKQVTPAIRTAAAKAGAEWIDMHPYLADKPQLMPDKIHPDATGSAIMAKRIYEQIILQYDDAFTMKDKIKLPVTYSEAFGYTSIDFKYRDRECHVVCPARAAKGHPWIWRARFYFHEPQTDIALLERGYHVVYCDAAELLGNAEAIDLWNGFYKMLRDGGLAQSGVLEGMSRGGMYVFNWAAANPDKVAAVYVDNPLLNLSDWLLNKAKPASREAFSKPFNLNTDEEIRNYKENPVDKIPEIVKGKYPVLILCADEDEAVSHETNTDLFAERIKAAGGEVTVMYKRGFKHHPHSFPDPTPIVDFIVKAVNAR